MVSAYSEPAKGTLSSAESATPLIQALLNQKKK
jgi:hypothetical protein